MNRLPGIGPRSAERLALHLIQAETAVAKRLAGVLVESRQQIVECGQCGGLAEKTPCAICANPARDERVLCVVERAVDILNVEKNAIFQVIRALDSLEKSTDTLIVDTPAGASDNRRIQDVFSDPYLGAVMLILLLLHLLQHSMRDPCTC